MANEFIVRISFSHVSPSWGWVSQGKLFGFRAETWWKLNRHPLARPRFVISDVSPRIQGELMPWKTRSPLTRYLEESTSSGQTSGISRRFPVFHFSTLPFSPPLSSWLSITVLGSSFIVFQSIYRSNRYHLFPSPSQTICHNFLNDETI